MIVPATQAIRSDTGSEKKAASAPKRMGNTIEATKNVIFRVSDSGSEI